MKVKYRGILSKPRPHDPPPGPLADDAANAEWRQRYKAAALERWRALFEAHDVKWGDESELLWRLAEAHVPGFRMRGPSGPKSVWGMNEKAELRIAVDAYVESRKRENKPASIAQACEVLSKRDPWKAMLRKSAGKPGEALRGHYNTADLRWVRVVRDAQKWDALPAHEKHRGAPLSDLARVARNSQQGTSRRKKST